MAVRSKFTDSVDEMVEQWVHAGPKVDLDVISVMMRVVAIARLHRRALTRVAARHGLIRQDMVILLALRRAARPLTPTELFQELFVTSGAMTKRIDQLESMGMVSRRPSKQDGRSTEIHLEKRARRIVDEDVNSNLEPEYGVFARLDPKRRAQLNDLLRECLNALEAIEER